MSIQKRIVRMSLVVVLVFMVVGVGGGRVYGQEWVTIKDDDGTADEKAQVCDDYAVLRKDLICSYSPEEIQQAWVVYSMKHNPYSTSTKLIHGGPVEGITWSNLIIRVNGKEALNDSLIKHGTQGWHEVKIDPALLKKGKNSIDFTLDGGGSYFYMGIDRSNPQGRSASSNDHGRNFNYDSVSPKAKKSLPAEYMVRLKLELKE